MIFEPQTGIAVVSHQRMRDDAIELKRILAEAKIVLAPGSVLANAIRDALKLAEWSEKPETMPKGRHAPLVIRRIVGMSYLARTLIHAGRDPLALTKLKSLLKHLALDNPIPTEPLEKAASSRNYVFELIVGGLFMAAGFDAQVAEEPDVTVERNGKWNFACKMVSSLESNTVGDNLHKGWEQVLRKKFAGNYGIVVMGLGQRLDHNIFLPVIDEREDYWGTFQTMDDPKRLLVIALEELTKQVLSQATTRIDDTDGRFRGVVLMAQTVSSYHTSPTMLTALRLITRENLFGSGLIAAEGEMIKSLNEEAQTVFSR
jgi:hypothetical protein